MSVARILQNPVTWLQTSWGGSDYVYFD